MDAEWAGFASLHEYLTRQAWLKHYQGEWTWEEWDTWKSANTTS